MSFRNRRSSSYGSLTGRRSSISSKDIEKIQQLLQLQKRKKLSPQILFCFIVFTPVFVHLLAQIAKLHYGSVFVFIEAGYHLQLPDVFSCSTPWTIFAVVLTIQLIFLLVLPSDDYVIKRESGDKKVINANSFISCLLICLLYVLGSTLKLFAPTLFFEQFLNLSVIFTLFVVLLIFALLHHHNEEDTNEPYINDFFFGKELQPRFLDIDVKNLITNRLGLTFWGLYAISSLYHNKLLFGQISNSLIFLVSLNLIYIARRQWTEHLNYTNLDAQQDRGGFYRLWGVVGLMLIHTMPISILASSKTSLHYQVCFAVAILNIAAQYLNSAVDLQKYNFRAAKGQLKIDDKDPFFIAAKYKTESGEAGVALLLGSGYFTSCRHLNYTFEFVTFLTWCLLLRTTNLLAFCSPVILLIILFDRMQKDDMRCLAKYNQYWLQFCNKVQYLAISGVY